MTRTPQPPYQEPPYRERPPQGPSPTAIVVGGIIGTVAIVAAAPVLLPLVGLGAIAALVTAPVGAGLGAIAGWWASHK
jgi:hypothetical protein